MPVYYYSSYTYDLTVSMYLRKNIRFFFSRNCKFLSLGFYYYFVLNMLCFNFLGANKVHLLKLEISQFSAKTS